MNVQCKRQAYKFHKGCQNSFTTYKHHHLENVRQLKKYKPTTSWQKCAIVSEYARKSIAKYASKSTATTHQILKDKQLQQLAITVICCSINNPACWEERSGRIRNPMYRVHFIYEMKLSVLRIRTSMAYFLLSNNQRCLLYDINIRGGYVQRKSPNSSYLHRHTRGVYTK